MPKIVLENVSKRFDDFVAVDDLNMVIEDREFITLLGPSGCGKTTTLRMIAGLETPTEGKITIGDQVVFDSSAGINVSPAKRDIGFLFQNYALWPHMTVYQNIAFGLENLKWPKAKIRERVNEMLAMLKIEQFEDRYPSELSGGQQQRAEEVGKEKQLQHHKNNKQFHQDDGPQRLSERHAAEAIIIQVEGAMPETLLIHGF